MGIHDDLTQVGTTTQGEDDFTFDDVTAEGLDLTSL